jgi:hypothetical protein
VTTNYHTDIAAGAAATAATLNAPLGQLDAQLNHDVSSYADTADGTTTVTTAGTFYAVTSYEVSFTPAYSGQVFTIAFVCGQFWPGTAGNTIANVRITDSASTTIVDYYLVGYNQAAGTGSYIGVSGTRAWTAGAGDVGVVRKAKVYVTHGVNGTVVHMAYRSLQAISH